MNSEDREWQHFELMQRQLRDRVIVAPKSNKDCSLVGAIKKHLKETEEKDDE